MGRKIISMFTLLAFLVFSLSCYTTSEKKVETVSKWKGRKVSLATVYSVLKKSGERIEFKKGHYGRIVPGGIEVRLSTKMVQKEIDIRDIQKIYRNKQGNIYGIDTLEGKRIEILGSEERPDKIIYLTFETDSEVIPFSELSSIQVKYYDNQKVIINSLLIATVIFAAAMWTFAKMLDPILSWEAL